MYYIPLRNKFIGDARSHQARSRQQHGQEDERENFDQWADSTGVIHALTR